LWPEPYPLPGAAVRALHDGQTLALLLQWRDETFEGAPVRVQDFQDAAAIQFSLTGRTPFIGMGDPENPVNVWQWKAGWQQDVDGDRPDVERTYASLHVDVYPEPSQHDLYRTAAAAGNLLASQGLESPIEDANATGFGTIATQPPAAQNVHGRGVWRDGFWSVVFLRELTSTDANDVQLTPGRPVPLALASMPTTAASPGSAPRMTPTTAGSPPTSATASSPAWASNTTSARTPICTVTRPPGTGATAIAPKGTPSTA
jgi:hypothetical protein